MVAGGREQANEDPATASPPDAVQAPVAAWPSDRLTLLAAVCISFTAADDDWDAVRNVANLLVPALGDICAINMAAPDGSRRRHIAAADPALQEVARALEGQSARLSPRALALGDALRAGRSVLLPRMEDVVALYEDVTSEHENLLRRLAPGSLLCVPVVGRDLPVGVLSLYTMGERRLSADDLSFAGEVTRRFAAWNRTAHLNARLAQREQRLHELTRDLVAAQEDERRRVARDLHDSVLQSVAAAHAHLQSYAEHHRPRSARARDHLRRALDLMSRGTREARQVVGGMRPLELETIGLVAAIRAEVDALRVRGLTATFESDLGAVRLPPALERGLYYVGREALANLRHAGPTAAQVSLVQADDEVILEVRDQGRGFHGDLALRRDGPGAPVGLIGMRERMELLGGSLEVSSVVDHGTRVIARAPLGAGDAGD